MTHQNAAYNNLHALIVERYQRWMRRGLIWLTIAHSWSCIVQNNDRFEAGYPGRLVPYPPRPGML